MSDSVPAVAGSSGSAVFGRTGSAFANTNWERPRFIVLPRNGEPIQWPRDLHLRPGEWPVILLLHDGGFRAGNLFDSRLEPPRAAPGSRHSILVMRPYEEASRPERSDFLEQNPGRVSRFALPAPTH